MSDDLRARITPLLRYVHPESFSDCTPEQKEAAGKELTYYSFAQGLPTHWTLLFEHRLEDGQWEWFLEPVDSRWVPLDGEADPGLGEGKHEYEIEVESTLKFRVKARASDAGRVYRWFLSKLTQHQAGVHLVGGETNFVIISADGQPEQDAS